MSDHLFSVVFKGEVREGRDIPAVKDSLAALLKIDSRGVDKFFSGQSVTLKKGIDYVAALKYVRAFRQAGARCRIEIETPQPSGAAAPVAGGSPAAVEKAGWLYEDVEKKLEGIKELNIGIDNIRRDQSGAWGKKRLALNVKLNEVCNERTEKMGDLIKKDKAALRDRINRLKLMARQLNPALQEADFTNPAAVDGLEESPLKLILQTIRRAYDLIRQIELTAENINVNPSTGTAKSGCFIATAVYGSSLAPQVRLFRQFRDRFLNRRGWGRTVVRGYYKISPPIARCIGRAAWLRAAARALLDALARRIAKKMEDPEREEA